MTHMAQWRHSSIVFNFGTRWKWVISFTPLSLHPQDIEPSGTHWIGEWVGPKTGLNAMGRRTISCPCLESNRGHPARTLVAIPTEPSRLLQIYLIALEFHYLLLRHHLVNTRVNTQTDLFAYSYGYLRNIDEHTSFCGTARKIKYHRNRKENVEGNKLISALWNSVSVYMRYLHVCCLKRAVVKRILAVYKQ
jgi:hypothetical protein